MISNAGFDYGFILCFVRFMCLVVCDYVKKLTVLRVTDVATD